MSTHAARKMRTILSNAQAVVAIELFTGAQAVEWRVVMHLDPNRRAPRLLNLDNAESQAEAFESGVRNNSEAIARSLGNGSALLYRRIRSTISPVFFDRPLDEDIRLVRREFFT